MKNWMIIVFFFVAFMWLSFQLGRSFADTGQPDIIVLSDTADCQVHKALIFELVEPSGRYVMDTKYKEFNKK